MRLYNANMVLYDTLMTAVNSLINYLTPTFAIWAGANCITFSCVLKDNTGKKPSALLLITMHQQFKQSATKQMINTNLYWKLVCGLLSTPRNKDTTPTTLFLEKLLTKLTSSPQYITNSKGTCWTCRKKGLQSPECPAKNNHSSDTTRRKAKNATWSLLQSDCILYGRK